MNGIFRFRITYQIIKDYKKITLVLTLLFMGMAVMYSGVYPAFAGEIKSTIINNQDEKNCNCEVKSEYKQVIAERLMTKLKININSIFLKLSKVPEVKEEFEELLDVINSDRPICDLVLQINASIRSKIQDLNDLIIQYRFHPIRGRIYLGYTLILLTINIYIIPLWFLSDCGDWP